MTRVGKPLQVRTEVRDGYVYVWQAGLVSNEAALRGLQTEIQAALNKAGTRVAMFDNRATEKPDEYVRAAMWTWLSEHVDRAALLQMTERTAKRADKTAVRNRVLVRAFHDEREAEDWLLGRASVEE